MEYRNKLPKNPVIFDPYKHFKEKTLNSSICVPSMVDSYSICIGYIKHWILSKLYPYKFETVWVDGKHIYDDYRKFSKLELLKRPLPSLTIMPSIDWSFNNENIDSYPYGLNMYSQTGRFKESFFKDSKNDVYLGISFETIMMPFNFRFRVESRSQQIDMYNHIKKACRVGFTCGEDVDLDFNISYDLILQIARDLGFETIIEDGSKERVKEISKFLHYLNLHSSLPFVYKHRNINGNNEFYLRLSNVYVHIRSTDISVGDGIQEGLLNNNYDIELSCEVRFPAPRFYAYYSEGNHKLQTLYSVKNALNDFDVRTFYQFKSIDIPEENCKGWNLFLTTSYEDNSYKDNKNLIIDFKELFEGDMARAIDQCIKSSISPAIFLEIVLINDSCKIRYKMDWENQILETKEPVKNNISFIGLYCDSDFMYNILSIIDETSKNKITSAKNPIKR